MPISQTSTSVDLLRQAQPIDCFVVPAPAGAMAFFGADFAAIRTRAPALRIDVYSPFSLSAGEMEYIRAEAEAELLTRAARLVRRGPDRRRAIVVAVVDLLILGLLLSFVAINGDRSFLIFFWLFSVVLLPGPLEALRAVAQRRAARRAALLLDTPVIAAVEGRGGAGTAAVAAVWEGVKPPGRGRDLAALQEVCRAHGWEAGTAFFRSLRHADSGDRFLNHSWLDRLINLFSASPLRSEPLHIPCRSS